MKSQKNISKYLLAVGFVLLIMSSCSTNSCLSELHKLLAQRDSYQQAHDQEYAQFVLDRKNAEIRVFAEIEKEALEKTKDNPKALDHV